MSATARESILARVRHALEGRVATNPPARAYKRSGTLERAELLDLLEQRLRDYRAEVVRVEPAEVPVAVAEIAPDARLGIPPALPEAWRPPGCVVDNLLTVAKLDDLDGALTGCSVAVAETGTLVLAGGKHEGRRALTLVPDLHVCVVEASQIVETVPEAFARLAPCGTRPLTLISGPSATSDIELRRVEGVHGPRRLVVLIVGSASAQELDLL